MKTPTGRLIETICRWALAALFAGWNAAPASPPPAGVGVTGNLSADDDQRSYFVTLASAGVLVLKTNSYAGGVSAAAGQVPAGGFDPTLSVFDSGGNLIANNKDGGCGNVAADPTTTFCWDAFLSLQLTAGTYQVVVTQSENVANGPTYADSFVFSGQGNFTTGGGAQGFLDESGAQRNGAFELDIQGASAVAAQLQITSSAALPPGVTLQPYRGFTFASQGGAGSAVWTLAAGQLPGGMMLTPAGVLQGAPSARGTYTFTVQADDGVQPVQQQVTLVVYDPLSLSSATLSNGAVNMPYGPVALAASGGSGVYSWTSFGLPPGLGVNGAGQISGTPSAAGTYNGTVQVTDGFASQQAFANVSITIAPAQLTVNGAGTIGGTSVGKNFSFSFAVTGGMAPYTWSATGLPGWLSIDPASGVLSGTPSQPGNVAFYVTVTDNLKTQTVAPVTVAVIGITTSTLPAGTTTTAYSQIFDAAGGTPPYTWSASGVPAGMLFSSSGLLNGIPKTASTYALNVQVTDSAGISASASFSLLVTPPLPLKIPGGPLTGGTSGTPYSTVLPAVGGATPYTWSTIGGALPDGLSISSSGTIEGTPSKPGTYTFTETATDASGVSVTGSFTIVIAPPQLTLTLGNLPSGMVNAPYPAQILSPNGGQPPYTFAISAGSLPPGLTLTNGEIGGTPTMAGTSDFSLTVTDSSSTPKTVQVPLEIKIRQSSADLILSVGSLNYSFVTGSNSVPPTSSVTIGSGLAQQVLTYSISVTPGAPWLTVTYAGTTTPGSFDVSINSGVSSLAASDTPYQASIVVACTGTTACANAKSTQTVTVSLTVSSAPPKLSVDTGLLSFSANTANQQSSGQTFGMQNAGGGTITVNSVTSSDTWVAISGVPATLPAGASVPITVTANVANLTPGYYRSVVSIVTSAGSAAVPVALLYAANNTMTLAPSGSLFRAIQGASPGNGAGGFGVSVAGNKTIAWRSAVMPGASWLNLATASGTSTSSNAGDVAFSIDPSAASLPAGAYYGTIRISSGDAANSPQDFEVVLNVASPADPVLPDPEPAGLIFIATSGSPVPPQTVTMFASLSGQATYQAAVSTLDGANWLSVNPSTGPASAAVATTVSVDPTGLAPGIYRGGVNYGLSAAAIRTVNVTLIVEGAPAGSSGSSVGKRDATSPSCTPAKLVPTQTGLPGNFSQPVAWPSQIAITVLNDCGSPVLNGQVVTTFSNGDPPLALVTGDKPGVYSGTWTPRGSASQVNISARATAPGFAAATTQITGQVTPNAAPVLTPGATLHVFDPLVGGALGPGNIVQIYGSNLSAQTIGASSIPLSSQLGGTSVIIGGVPAPLYYVSPGQINAQVPFELTAGNRYQVVVSANGALTTPDTIQLSPVSPGVAAFPSGQIIAQHLDGSLVTQDSPAKPGEIVVFYLAGMGLTDVPVGSGQASPSATLAHPVDAPTLTLNGTNVPPLFAGLTPGLVGLYQVNFAVPADAPDGDLQLVVSQAGSPSNMTLLPVKH